jgi:hypothetical protein
VYLSSRIDYETPQRIGFKGGIGLLYKIQRFSLSLGWSLAYTKKFLTGNEHSINFMQSGLYLKYNYGRVDFISNLEMRAPLFYYDFQWGAKFNISET